MKFSDKLIKLRKEKLLSQEELGEKLNVTRQTVSKWELGQTTPDMEKLVEMSKIFGVSLDELTNNGEISNNDPIKEKNNSKRSVIIIVVLLLVIICAFAFIARSFLKKQESVFGLFGQITDSFGMTKRNFNNSFEYYNGTKYGLMVNSLIDTIVTNNKTNDRIVTVQYNDIITSVPNELINIKRNLNASRNYEISFLYNEEGYIYQAIIEDIENNMADEDENQMNEGKKQQNEFEKNSFNRTFEVSAGTKTGPVVQWLIDDVIINNQKNTRLVKVKYNDTEATDPAELRTLKRNFDDARINYEVYFEYDEDGYIYKAIIEKI